ncbi:hypothetical protein FGO68_gene8415 [Halteria grandinella]|uniref:Uncharacterized protein n=1 Tax=Halteria grandinella TaxID=5974 RepID=A0A8J8NHK0_HALGN|nr:hypothetical protein FGO68_gene8415 [Halteria grandinella]
MRMECHIHNLNAFHHTPIIHHGVSVPLSGPADYFHEYWFLALEIILIARLHAIASILNGQVHLLVSRFALLVNVDLTVAVQVLKAAFEVARVEVAKVVEEEIHSLSIMQYIISVQYLSPL